MPFIPVPNTIRAELRFSIDNQQIMNTLWFEKGSAWSASDIEAVATQLVAWWDGAMAPLLTVGVTLREVYARDMSEEPSIEATSAAALTGDVAETYMPNNVALCTSFRTGLTGRSFRGRNYISGMSRAQVTSNVFSGPWAASVTVAYEGLNASIGSVVPGAFHVVASLASEGEPRTTGVTTPVLSYLNTDLVVDSQRRRLPGRGV